MKLKVHKETHTFMVNGFSFEVAQADFKLGTQLSLLLNSLPFCIRFPSTGINSVHHHTWLGYLVPEKDAFAV